MTDVPTFLLVAGLVYLGVIGAIVSGFLTPVREGKFLEIAHELGFVVDGKVLRGTWSGVPVTIERQGRSIAVYAPAPADVWIGGSRAAWGQQGERFRSGDGPLDEGTLFYGPHDRLVAALDGATRVQVRELLSTHFGAAVASGRVCRPLKPVELHSGTIALVLNTVTELSRALQVAPEAARLAGIARTDLYAGVRRNALDVLARLHPHDVGPVAEALLDDRDLAVRIEAARLAGDVGTRHLAAGDPDDLDAAVHADPKGMPLRLAVLGEATLLELLETAHRLGRSAVAEALGRVGTVHAVEPLLAAGFVTEARAIQARLGEVEAGRLSLSDAEGGQLALAAEAGRLAVVPDR
ncbi:MAG: hypothetical protein Q8P41_29310 [Pseudomonadota bacterium]|nr:hypothetical protein [Pseudomonadota bacterium]